MKCCENCRRARMTVQSGWLAVAMAQFEKCRSGVRGSEIKAFSSGAGVGNSSTRE